MELVDGLTGGQQLTVRPATHQDYEAVLRLNTHQRIYHAYDYLPEVYHVLLHVPNSHPFVALLEGKVVAYRCCRLMDWCDRTERTFLTVAGRVDPHYERMGINSRMSKMVYQAVIGLYPGPCTFLTLSAPYEGLARRLQAGNLVKLHHWSLLTYEIKTKDLFTIPAQHLSLDTRLLSQTAALRMLPRLTTFLKQHQFITFQEYSHWMVLEVTDNNVRRAIISNDVILSLLESPNSSTESVLAVTFLGIKSADGKIATNFNYHGDSTELCKSHLTLYVEQAKKLVLDPNEDGQSLLYIHFPPGLRRSELADWMPGKFKRLPVFDESVYLLKSL